MNLRPTFLCVLLLASLSLPAVSAGEPITPGAGYALMVDVDPPPEHIPPGGFARGTATIALLCGMGVYAPAPETVLFTASTNVEWALVYLGQHVWTPDTGDCTTGTRINKEIRLFFEVDEDAPAFGGFEVTVDAESENAAKSRAQNLAKAGYRGDLSLDQSHIRLALPAGGSTDVALPVVLDSNGETLLTTRLTQSSDVLQAFPPGPTITCASTDPGCDPVRPSVRIDAPFDADPGTHLLEFEVAGRSNDDLSDGGSIRVPVIVDLIEAAAEAPAEVGELPSPLLVPMLTALGLVGLLRRRGH